MNKQPVASIVKTNDKTLIIIDGLSFDKELITIEGGHRDSIANGIVRMINENQCSECGKFNGLHGEVFHGHSVAGTGSVEGYYTMCSKGKK